MFLVLVFYFASCEKEGLTPTSSSETTIRGVIRQDVTNYSDHNASKIISERRLASKVLFSKSPQAFCPLPNDKFSGNYNLSYIGDATGEFGIPFEEGTVFVQPVFGSSTKRIFFRSWAPELGGFAAPDFIFDFVCENVIVADFGTGLACAGGEITIVQGEPSSFDFSDDSEIILNIIECQTDGGCGISPQPKTIRLTKE